jgi:hypothetical protein
VLPRLRAIHRREHRLLLRPTRRVFPCSRRYYGADRTGASYALWWWRDACAKAVADETATAGTGGAAGPLLRDATYVVLALAETALTAVGAGAARLSAIRAYAGSASWIAEESIAAALNVGGAAFFEIRYAHRRRRGRGCARSSARRGGATHVCTT